MQHHTHMYIHQNLLYLGGKENGKENGNAGKGLPLQWDHTKNSDKDRYSRDLYCGVSDAASAPPESYLVMIVCSPGQYLRCPSLGTYYDCMYACRPYLVDLISVGSTSTTQSGDALRWLRK